MVQQTTLTCCCYLPFGLFSAFVVVAVVWYTFCEGRLKCSAEAAGLHTPAMCTQLAAYLWSTATGAIYNSATILIMLVSQSQQQQQQFQHPKQWNSQLP